MNPEPPLRNDSSSSHIAVPVEPATEAASELACDLRAALDAAEREQERLRAALADCALAALDAAKFQAALEVEVRAVRLGNYELIRHAWQEHDCQHGEPVPSTAVAEHDEQIAAAAIANYFIPLEPAQNIRWHDEQIRQDERERLRAVVLGLGGNPVFRVFDVLALLGSHPAMSTDHNISG